MMAIEDDDEDDDENRDGTWPGSRERERRCEERFWRLEDDIDDNNSLGDDDNDEGCDQQG